jgi:glycosyltransferase involved in cell wall biosynthesis
MHILMLHQYYCPPAGSGNDRTRDFAQYFHQAGCKVTVITSQARFPVALRSQSVFDQVIEGVRVIACPLPDPHPLNYARRLKVYASFFCFALRTGKGIHDVQKVYACSTPLTVGEVGRRIAKYHKIPYLYETQDVWPDALYGMGIVRSKLLQHFLDWATRRIYQQAHHIIALSDDMVPQICRLGDFHAKINVVPNGTDTQLFTPNLKSDTESDFVFVYAGAIGRANDIMQLMDAIRILAAQNIQGIRVLIIGNGNRYAQVRAAAKGLDNYITWENSMPKSEVAIRIQNAHAGVVCFAPFTVLQANSANKFFDYLSAGLPVLINYGGWQASVLAQYDCGISAPAGNPEALAKAMQQLAADRKKSSEMGLNARLLALRLYDRKMLAQQVLNLIYPQMT